MPFYKRVSNRKRFDPFTCINWSEATLWKRLVRPSLEHRWQNNTGRIELVKPRDDGGQKAVPELHFLADILSYILSLIIYIYVWYYNCLQLFYDISEYSVYDNFILTACILACMCVCARHQLVDMQNNPKKASLIGEDSMPIQLHISDCEP